MIRLNRINVFIFISFLNICVLDINARVGRILTDIPESVFTNITAKGKNGRYKAQKINGKITGCGAFHAKNGDLYFGDFKDKEFNGSGMLIGADSISNCPECVVYVGRFKKGLKNGVGRCYNSDGELIYSGKFVEDRPVDKYPAVGSIEVVPTFIAEYTATDYRFIGEYKEDMPSGFGAFVFNNGDLYVSHFKEGVANGISVFIGNNGDWVSEMNDNGESSMISSSAEYSMLKKKARESMRSAMALVIGKFAEAIDAGCSVAEQVKSISSGEDIQEYTSSDFDSSTAKSAGSSNKSKNGNEKYNISEQQSYNRDKSTYHKYDKMLASAFAGNRDASASQISEWQSKMRKLREKWEAKGRDFPHFPNEDK